MNILGLNAFCGDASAALVQDGVLVAAIGEERLNRRRHSAGFPALAAKAVLAEAGLSAVDIDHVAVSRDPKANLHKKLLFAARRGSSASQVIRERLAYAARVQSISEPLAAALGAAPGDLTAKIHRVEHHKCHVASAFFVSPFEEAACLSIGAFGDFVSTMRGLGRGPDLDVLDRVEFPHSAGLFTTAIAQFLGFRGYGDDWKVMALASYGAPTYAKELRQLIHGVEGGRFELNLEYFRHHNEAVPMTWDDQSPQLGLVYSPRLSELLGPARDPEDPNLLGKWADIAHSAQLVYEEIFCHVLVDLQRRAGIDKLSLAGGCALNSVANGKIFERSKFRRLFAPPAAGNDGTAIGAAFHVEHVVLHRPRRFVMRDAYMGPAFDDGQVSAAIDRARSSGWDPTITVRRLQDPDLYREIARATAAGQVVGWFQGRMEFGQRGLGNRSVIADPRRAEMKDVVSRRIGPRDSHRPLAPSVLEERAFEVFERKEPSPFMMVAYRIREAYRGRLAAAAPVDVASDLQTVSAATNPRYHALISEFERQTGVPLVLSTGFNECEQPIVTTPAEALACYTATRMDVLALGNWVLTRTGSPTA